MIEILKTELFSRSQCIKGKSEILTNSHKGDEITTEENNTTRFSSSRSTCPIELAGKIWITWSTRWNSLLAQDAKCLKLAELCSRCPASRCRLRLFSRLRTVHFETGWVDRCPSSRMTHAAMWSHVLFSPQNSPLRDLLDIVIDDPCCRPRPTSSRIRPSPSRILASRSSDLIVGTLFTLQDPFPELAELFN